MTIQLKTASYKGVDLLFLDATTTGGNRVVKFNYPGSNIQQIEVQGRAPRAFTLTLVIPHEDYFATRDRVLRVLEDGESGVLVHPTFGELPNMVNGKYTLVEKLTELGRAEITVPFDVDDGDGVTEAAAPTPAQVASLASVAVAQVGADFAGGYGVSLSFPANLTDARENVAAVPVALRAASRVAEPLAAKAAEFNRALNAFEAQVGDLVQAPSDLSETILTTFEQLNAVYDQPSVLLGAFSTLLAFGADDPVYPLNTAGRTERASNRATVRTSMRVLALCYAYTAAAQVEFPTTDALDSTSAELEAAYVDIITDPGLVNESQERLDRLRVQAQLSFDAARVSARSIITVTTPLIPLSTLVYSYYGSTDLVDIIAELNNIKQNAFVEGELRILTE